MKIKLLVFFVILIASIIFFPISLHIFNTDNISVLTEQKNAAINNTVTVKLTSIGDFLMHLPIIKSAYDNNTKAYNFQPVFAPVEEYLQDSDLTIGNLETRLAGPEKGYSGYPLFNCPADLAVDLKKLGIDIITLANNHCLDMGWNGLITTMNNLEQAGMQYIGNARSPEERDNLLIKDIKGIKLGFLNYTETTNGLPVPEGKDFGVNLINLDIIKKDIASLISNRADIVIVYLHFGTEYKRYPTENQKKLARQVFDAGADIILGDHVHVLQPMEREGEKFIIYSLGNFISNQRWQYSDSGIILNLTFEKNLEQNKTHLKNIDYIPVWVDTYPAAGMLRYRVLAVEKAIADYQNGNDPLLTAEDYTRLKEVWEETTTLMSRPEQNIMPVMLLKNPERA
ncbi:Putative protein of poly-gamma-glutamate biosynthesis (capsule formation)-like protein [Desulfofarcimen acetoxidans DSM 771]|uniref:Capsule synthesis protein CapA domain-containing protein n=1 Tax=Desulfofarcimen acetoxidans (strain ATCC 49208 / DSM 771 / KCTC 5769 / VKM B-1644 / 5575) TaxID=485916 RepID=C8W4B1_DESAS|nr:CapA family protein [Desulfofarcimen acetoxidans]ACV61979.1 Putative protein of poly-gamma-glutamate biosynthesis (capsule formation)-like protein [Desulfofarcimen acetoxidans DSM 771]